MPVTPDAARRLAQSKRDSEDILGFLRLQTEIDEFLSRCFVGKEVSFILKRSVDAKQVETLLDLYRRAGWTVNYEPEKYKGNYDLYIRPCLVFNQK